MLEQRLAGILLRDRRAIELRLGAYRIVGFRYSPAKLVDRSRAGDHHHPGDERGPPRVKRGTSLPHLQQRDLKHILGRRAVAEHRGQGAQQQRAKVGLDPRQRALVADAERVREFAVAAVLGPLSGTGKLTVFAPTNAAFAKGRSRRWRRWARTRHC
jgi:hypothetical protein